jgi:hypothetical protein
MKNLKWIFLPTMLTAMLLLFVVSCHESFVQEPIPDQSMNTEKIIEWNDLLNQFDLSRDIIIVQKEGSIQEAIDAAKPGDAIYIEPGTYKEALKISKDYIKLIGLNGPANENVIIENPGGIEKCISTADGKNIEIINITAKNFNDIGFKISLKCTSNPANKCVLISMKRSELLGGIAHYKFELRVGNGPFDVVGIHRIVKEYRPYQPVHTQGDIFMVHGAIQDFDDIFLTVGAENVNAKTSSPVYLASKNIDVWGIDLAWTKVLIETTDFSFMKDWGVEKDIDHTLAAMSFARLVRCISSHNYDKMNLLGFSYGLQLAYGAAGRETQQHPILRNIKGLIPVDGIMKYAPEDEEFRINACNSAAALKDLLDNGKFQCDDGTTFIFLGNLALTAPDDPSPIPDFAGFTNKQVLLLLGTMTYITGNPGAPFDHFVGGDLGDLYYSDSQRWLRVASSIAPYQPQRQMYEFYACNCNEEDVRYDDHIREISLPIFYLGSGGSSGTLGYYTSNLTASSDITNYTVSVTDDRSIDFGHADLWMGRDADKLVWEPLRKWLVKHN